MPESVIEFQAIDDSFRPKILRYPVRLVGQHEAEDLAQTVMMKVSEGLREFRGASKLSTWIYRIATNAALDSLRHKAIQPSSETEFVSDGCDVPPEALIPSVEAAAIRKEMNECIHEFIERLPENYKTVMVLSELEGFKNSEIAAILGVSLDTVKIRLHRARERFRKSLQTGCSFYRNAGNELACGRKA